MVKHISDRVAVMYLGKIVEMSDAETIYQAPKHAYTKALLDAIPEDVYKRQVDIESPMDRAERWARRMRQTDHTEAVRDKARGYAWRAVMYKTSFDGLLQGCLLYTSRCV